jgi:hypothetical protein
VNPVLADYGLAFYSINDDCPLSDNPEDYLINSTSTSYAPVSFPLLSSHEKN